MSAQDQPVIDEEKTDDMRDLLGEGPDGFDGLVEDFLDRIPAVIDDARSAAQDGRLEDLESLAHKVKGEAATLGATRLSDRARQIEENSREETIDDPGAAVDDLERLFEETKNAFEE